MVLMPRRAIQCWCLTCLSRPSDGGAEVAARLWTTTTTMARRGGRTSCLLSSGACASRTSAQCESVRVKVRAHCGRGGSRRLLFKFRPCSRVSVSLSRTPLRPVERARGLVGNPPGMFLPIGRPRRAELMEKLRKEGLNHDSQLGVTMTIRDREVQRGGVCVEPIESRQGQPGRRGQL